MVKGYHGKPLASLRKGRGMRAALVALAVVGLLLPVSLGPAAARDGALAPPKTVQDGDGVRWIEWEGASALHLAGACAATARACVGSAESEDGRFFLPGVGSGGSVLVWWDAVDPALRTLRVRVGDRVAEGTSPVRLDVPGSEPGEYRVRVEPARNVAGKHDQPVAWRASFHVQTPLSALAIAGTSRYDAVTGCALVLCDATTMRHASDPLLAPWTATGRLVARWDPDLGPLRVTIPGADLGGEGNPPLSFPLDGLAPGEWRVQVDPMSAAFPLESAKVLWSARIARAP